MDKERIQKAAQLADDLKKVNRALALYEGTDQVAVRLSGNVDGEAMFAYLPKSIVPALYTVLQEAKNYVTKQMEDL